MLWLFNLCVLMAKIKTESFLLLLFFFKYENVKFLKLKTFWIYITISVAHTKTVVKLVKL